MVRVRERGEIFALLSHISPDISTVHLFEFQIHLILFVRRINIYIYTEIAHLPAIMFYICDICNLRKCRHALILSRQILGYVARWAGYLQ